MRKKIILAVLVLGVFLVVADLYHMSVRVEGAAPGVVVGNDRDLHGCIGSAGYTWCETKEKCLRSWEESCGATSTPAGTTPPHNTTPVAPVPTQASCGIENCHGLEIQCGPKPVEMCTEMYALGDKCRAYATCGIVRGTCIQIQNARFTACKTCVQSCVTSHPNDPAQQFSCESECT